MWEVLIWICWNVSRDGRNTQRFHLLIFTLFFSCFDRNVKTDTLFSTSFCFISLFETASQLLLPRFRTGLKNLQIYIFGVKFYKLVALFRLFFLFEYVIQGWCFDALLLFQIYLAWKGIILRFLIIKLLILVFIWAICLYFLLKTSHRLFLSILIMLIRLITSVSLLCAVLIKWRWLIFRILAKNSWQRIIWHKVVPAFGILVRIGRISMLF